MFNDLERDILNNVFMRCIESVKDYRKTHGVRLDEVPADELYTPFEEQYMKISGEEMVFDPHEVMSRHYLSRWKKYRGEP